MMGVIGYHKPQFSLIGDTMNTTSRVCATGSPGHIMMSGEFFNQCERYTIKSGLKLEQAMTYMKGKGDVLVYHLYKKTNMLKNRLIKALSKSNNKSPESLDIAKLTIFKAKKLANATNNDVFGKYNGFIKSISTRYKVDSSNREPSETLRQNANGNINNAIIPQPSLNSIVNENQMQNVNANAGKSNFDESYNTSSISEINETFQNAENDYEVCL